MANQNRETECRMDEDLLILGEATEGPWHAASTTDGGYYVLDESGETIAAGIFKTADAWIMVNARTLWPHAIKRAQAAEDEAEVYRKALGAITVRLRQAQAWTDEAYAAYYAHKALREGEAARNGLLEIERRRKEKEWRAEWDELEKGADIDDD